MEQFSLLRPTGDDLAYLKARWKTLWEELSPAATKGEALFHELTSLYAGEERFYHNLRHVAELLRLIENLRDEVRDMTAVSLAVWFHDAVYDTRRQDNEEASAELAAHRLSGAGVPEETTSIVRALILATRSHTTEGAGPDAPLFLDADLSILGAPPEIYAPYRGAIRREYAWVPEFLYRRGRKKILRAFAARPRLYSTDAMRLRFEAQARANLNEELALLSAS